MYTDSEVAIVAIMLSTQKCVLDYKFEMCKVYSIVCYKPTDLVIGLTSSDCKSVKKNFFLLEQYNFWLWDRHLQQFADAYFWLYVSPMYKN